MPFQIPIGLDDSVREIVKTARRTGGQVRGPGPMKVFRPSLIPALVGFLWLVGCAGDDRATSDGPHRDGLPVDAQQRVDAAPPDTLPVDAGLADAADGPVAADASSPPDSHPVDAPQSDAAAADAVHPDAPPVDAGFADAWTPDGGTSPMVLIPAGPFVMGSDPGEGFSDERPEHVVTLGSYLIGVHEVTNAEYRECVTAGACTPPASTSSWTRTVYFTSPLYDAYPVISVTWSQAVAFCAWTGKRLPTEAEWEKAARGGCNVVAPASCGPEDERTYPWGEEYPSCSLANGNYCFGDTDVVGGHSPQGDSPYGLQDMAGNVYEWAADWYSSDYSSCAAGCTDPTGPASGTERVIRGGSWYGGGFGSTASVASRSSRLPTTADIYLGFRCAKTP